LVFWHSVSATIAVLHALPAVFPGQASSQKVSPQAHPAKHV
jgi:hypothetical protein